MKKPNNNIDVMYFHGTTVDGRRFTISGIIKDADLHLGGAICSEIEQFSKVKGRTISSGRVLNQRPGSRGRTLVSLYSDKISDEFRGELGFPEDYYKGNEIKVFKAYVMNYNHFTQKELQMEFRLLQLQPKNS